MLPLKGKKERGSFKDMTGITKVGRNRQNIFKWMGQITFLKKRNPNNQHRLWRSGVYFSYVKDEPIDLSMLGIRVLTLRD